MDRGGVADHRRELLAGNARSSAVRVSSMRAPGTQWPGLTASREMLFTPYLALALRACSEMNW